MKVLHNCAESASQEDAIAVLESFIERLRGGKLRLESWDGFEKELHEIIIAAERELLAEGLSQFDVDLPLIQVEGMCYRRVMRSETNYTSAAGAVRVKRSLYSSREAGARTLCPLEMRAGIIGGHWTPLAAKQAAWTVSHMTPQEAEDLFHQLGHMEPSKSSFDRLPKLLSERWEEQREQFEAALRSQATVAQQAATVAVSLDGVMAPMKDGRREEKRAQAQADGKRRAGPAGYQEVGCATVSFYDTQGERLSTVRFARMPESKKRTLKNRLSSEIEAILEQRPELKLVKLADGARDNWSYLSHELPAGTELLDFYHAAAHLKDVFDAAYGENTPKAQAQFKKYRHILREEDDGAAKVIRALTYLQRKYPRRKKLKTELEYFRRNRSRMSYAQAKAEGLPIGSGVVEAACKTLVSQRLKRSGMRWRHQGGQAILTLRSLVQSGCFERGWQMLAQTFKQKITIPHNVVLLNKHAIA